MRAAAAALAISWVVVAAALWRAGGSFDSFGVLVFVLAAIASATWAALSWWGHRASKAFRRSIAVWVVAVNSLAFGWLVVVGWAFVVFLGGPE